VKKGDGFGAVVRVDLFEVFGEIIVGKEDDLFL